MYFVFLSVGPPPVPIVGNVLAGLGVTPKDALKKIMQFYNEYGPVVCLFLGPKAYVILADPQDVEVILSSSVHIDKSPEYQ